MQTQGYAYAYCVSCNAGSEAQLCKDICRELPDAAALYPLFDRKELRRGEWSLRPRPLVPGYVFVYTQERVDAAALYRCERANRVLSYGRCNGEAEHALQGADLAFAQWVYENNGHLGVSQAVMVGDEAKIIAGPLASYQGEILKINRKKHCALVSISVGDTAKEIWLALEWMAPKAGVLEGYKLETGSVPKP